MECGNCSKQIKNGDTCYSKKGVDDIYCSAECFAETYSDIGTYEGDE